MELNAISTMKEKMRTGGKVIGQVIGPGGDPEKTVQDLKDSGDDFILLETEHSLINKETILEYIKVCHHLSMALLLRTEDKAAHFRCYLDSGVSGLVLPLVHTVEEAARAVSTCYLPPLGHRGCGIGLSPYLVDPQDLTRAPFKELMEYVNSNTMLFPQTESLESIGNLPSILGMEGITGTLVGPFDLAIDMKIINPKALASDVVTNPQLEGKLKQILRICKNAGKVAGIGGFPPRVLAKWAKLGYNLLNVGSILNENVDALRPAMEEVRSLIS